MPNQILFEDPRESRYSASRATLILIAIFFTLNLCVPRDAAAALAPVITSATTASATVGSTFSYQITATSSPNSYRATGLPAGLTVNTRTGLISGTPTAAGTSTVTLSASNYGGSGRATLTLSVVATVPVITSPTTASCATGLSCSYQIVATGSPTSFSATGLPGTLTLNASTGLISGTPTSLATYTIILGSTNGGGTGNTTLTLTVGYFVQQAYCSIQSASTVSCPFTRNLTAGDLIVLPFDFAAGLTVSSVKDALGNSYAQIGSQLATPGGDTSQVWYAKNIMGGADTITITFRGTASYAEVWPGEYAGLNKTSPIDVQAGAYGSAGPASSGNATTTVANDLIWGLCIPDVTCPAPGSSFIARSTAGSSIVEDKVGVTPGSYSATATVTGSGWSMQMVAFKPASTGTGAAVSLSPGSLTFASQGVGATSSSQSITLNNSGNGALNVASIAVTGTNAGDFSQTNTCGSSLSAGTSCTIGVTFKPTATGTRTAAITLTDNATGSPQSVGLSGTGAGTVGGAAGPVASLSLSSLNFGNEPVSIISSSQVVTLTNSGSATLNIAGIALTGANAADFTEVNTCGASLAAGGSCTIAILFTPSAIGTRGTSLVITDNASNSPQSVSLSGAGVHDVVLTWTANGTSGVAGYNIYRGTTSGGESSTALNSGPFNGTVFTDTNVTPGTSYYYVVKAVGSNDVTQSASSNETSVTVPSP
jgi:hypothetical protein